MEINKIHQGDCLELMNQIEDKSVDMILCDLPYGTTACKWDSIIDLKKLWKQYKRIIKDKGIIILTSSQPFTTTLINSNMDWFRYELIWSKTKGGGFALANKMPLKRHENILVFYNKLPSYNPQKEVIPVFKRDRRKTLNISSTKCNYMDFECNRPKIDEGTRHPTSVLNFNSEWNKGMHPTQKPVELFKYLIKTYTNEGDLVLDNCIGSGTTAVACKQLNRDFIGIELNEKYVKMADERIKPYLEQTSLFSTNRK